MRMTVLVATLVTVGCIFGSACTSGVNAIAAGPGSFASVDTMSPGWESRFRLDWKVTADRQELRKIAGYLHNDYGQTVRVRLLVKGLDASGAVVFRRVEQTFSALPPFERDFFEFDRLPAADRYVVYSYEPASRA
jgi:hypothetical protein